MQKRILFLISFALFTSLIVNSGFAIQFPNRINITIDNTLNSETLDSYQIPLNITWNNNMTADFRDLRFTESSNNDSTLWLYNYSYWIENKSNSEWAYAWVKVPFITALMNNTMFLYYNNDSLISDINNITETSFNNTGMYFTTGYISTLFRCGSAGSLVAGAYFGTMTTTTYTSGYTCFYRILNMTNNIIVRSVERKTLIAGGSNEFTGISIRANNLTGGSNRGLAWVLKDNGGASNVIRQQQIEESTLNSTTYVWNLNAWYGLEAVLNNSNTFVTKWWNYSSPETTASYVWQTAGSNSSGYIYGGLIGVGTPGQDGTQDYQYLFFRKYTNPEPIIYIGIPESTSPPPPPAPIPFITPVSSQYCLDNNTLFFNNTNSMIVNGSLTIYTNLSSTYCSYGCDNISFTCNPPQYQQDIYNFLIIIGILIIFAWLYKKFVRL